MEGRLKTGKSNPRLKPTIPLNEDKNHFNRTSGARFPLFPKSEHQNKRPNESNIQKQNKPLENERDQKAQQDSQQKKTPLRILLQQSRLRAIQNQYSNNQHKLKVNVLPNYVYYPPTCCGFQVAYSKLNNSIYAYGGFSCGKQFSQGLQPYFYQYKEGKWIEVKPVSEYLPMPRYGHTLTVTQTGKQMILFGGVSQYKQKLKDRCFYADISVFNIEKNKWKVIKISGPRIKIRKNHTAAFYGKYYLVYGGIDDSEQVLGQLNWISFDNKKIRWKSMPAPARFNHKMSCIQNQGGKDYLCIYGGRNSASQINSSFFLYQLMVANGSLSVKPPITLQHTMSARQIPIMNQINPGRIFIMGGIDQNNEVVQDSWYFNCQKQSFVRAEIDLDIKELRGCKATTMSAGRVFILSAISKKYKALEIYKQKML